MPTKIGINQHEILHQHYPNDCCLCKSEARIIELENKISSLQEKPNKVYNEDAIFMCKKHTRVNCGECFEVLPKNYDEVGVEEIEEDIIETESTSETREWDREIELKPKEIKQIRDRNLKRIKEIATTLLTHFKISRR